MGPYIFLNQEWTINITCNIHFYTYSSGLSHLSIGAYFNGELCIYPWPQSWDSSRAWRNLTFLELVPVVLAISLWGEKLSNKK